LIPVEVLKMKFYGIGVTVLCTLFILHATVADDKAEKKKEEYGTVIGIDLGTTYSW